MKSHRSTCTAGRPELPASPPPQAEIPALPQGAATSVAERDITDIPSEESAVTPFSTWRAEWKGASAAERPALLQRGTELAAQRAERMLELMRHRPEEALRQALSWSKWMSLPEPVRALVEEPFSATGEYAVRSDCRPVAERRAKPNHLVWFETEEGSLKVHPWAGGEDVLSKDRLPVQGIRLSGEAVLRTGVLEQLDNSDAAAVAGLFPVRDGDPGGPITALLGGRRVSFPDEAAANRLANDLAASLAMVGPHTVSAGLAVAYSSSSGAGNSVIGGASASSHRCDRQRDLPDLSL